LGGRFNDMAKDLTERVGVLREALVLSSEHVAGRSLAQALKVDDVEG
jgi:hypothetical protein